MLVPDVLGDVGAADDVAGAPREILEERVFPRVSADFASPTSARGCAVSSATTDDHRRSGSSGRRPRRDQGAHAREQLAEVERLGQVVVGAGSRVPATRASTASRAVSIRTGTALPAARSAAHGEAVAAGQHDVENDRVVVGGLRP